MCTFCNRFKVKLNPNWVKYSISSASYLRSTSSDDESEFSEGSNESICSAHYSSLQRKYLPRSRSKHTLNTANRSPLKCLKDYTSNRRDVPSISVQSNSAEVRLLQRISSLESIVKEKEKTIMTLQLENDKLRSTCSAALSHTSNQNSKAVGNVVEKLQAELNLQKEQSSRLASMIREMQKLTANNSELAHSLLHQRHSPVQHSKRKDSVQQTKQEASHRKHSDSWKDNFVSVFLDLVSRLGKSEGFLIPQNYSLRRKIKACWRYLKQFIRFYHNEKGTDIQGPRYEYQQRQ